MNWEVGWAVIAQIVKVAHHLSMPSIRVNWEFSSNCGASMWHYLALLVFSIFRLNTLYYFLDNTKDKRPLCISIAVTGQKKAEYQLSSSQQYIFKVLAVHMTLTLNCQGFDRQVLSWPMCTRLQILILVEEQVNKVNIPKPWQTDKINFFVKNKYLPLPKCLEAYAWIMSFQQVIEFWHWVEYQIFVCFKIFKCSWVFHFGALSSYFKPYLF